MRAVLALALSLVLAIAIDIPLVKKLECIPYWKVRLTSNYRKQVKFYLFTWENPACFQILTTNHTIRLKLSNFSPYWPIRFLIPDWKDNLYSTMIQTIAAAYTQKGNFNVIVVDWSSLATNTNYNAALSLIEPIGKSVADFTLFLQHTAGITFNNIYLIGHGLGAQIAGSAGLQSPGMFNTIFALDPAKVNFTSQSNKTGIKPSSARYVESIQTDVGLIGAASAVGHASFFPNFGRVQRECQLRSCFHYKAYHYFAESINSDIGFWGMPCKDIREIIYRRCTSSGNNTLMGGEPAAKKFGYFYLPTNNKTPFARGFYIKN